MAKQKIAFVCNECGADLSKWQGQCPECGQWNTIQEIKLGKISSSRVASSAGYAGASSEITTLGAIDLEDQPRFSSGVGEFDRVLGGGLVPGSAILVGGHPGAGKSTLLKILSRIVEPTDGQATVYGRVASLLEIGTGFHRELSGRENIYLNGTILGMTKNEIKENFDDIVEFSEIGKFIDTTVKRYSSGMYVRLAFAVAAHLNPEILIVDEVLAVGDAAFKKKCLGKMGETAKSGRTVLFVSHNIHTIQELINRKNLLVDCKIDNEWIT